MKLPKERIIEELYMSGIFADAQTSSKYNELIREYNKLYENIEDSILKEKFKKLEELKNNLNSESDTQIFKLGFSVATKMILDSVSIDNLSIIFLSISSS